MTQEALTHRIGSGLRQSEISRLERDGVALPRRERMEAIAVALDLSLGDLMVRTGWIDPEHASAMTIERSVASSEVHDAVATLTAARQLVRQAADLLASAEARMASVTEHTAPAGRANGWLLGVGRRPTETRPDRSGRTKAAETARCRAVGVPVNRAGEGPAGECRCPL